MSRSDRIRELRRTRPRSRLLRGSLLLAVGLVAWAWLQGDLAPADFFHARRGQSLLRFLGEIRPYPWQQDSQASIGPWLQALWRERGGPGALQTLSLALAAMLFAGSFALLTSPLGAATLARPDPLQPVARARSRRRVAWWLVRFAARTCWVLMRAIPEYIWAFLLLAVLGPVAWPAVLALAIHNGGILSRLSAETIENLPPGPLQALGHLGASRAQLSLFGVYPLARNRFLLYFFYRLESCVREATVLGMLGVLSLGYWIQDARSRQFYDEMLFFVALGAGIVLGTDAFSALMRGWIRRG